MKKTIKNLIILFMLGLICVNTGMAEDEEAIPQSQRDPKWREDFINRQSQYFQSRHLSVVGQHVEPPETIKAFDPNIISGRISGKISLQAHLSHALPVTLEVRYPSHAVPIKTYHFTPAEDGEYNISPLPAGTYDITLKASNSLRTKIKNVTITSGETVAALDFELIFGDADGNNVINIFDHSIMNGAFGSKRGDDNWDERADFDGNGVINIFDHSIMNGNFGKVGAE